MCVVKVGGFFIVRFISIHFIHIQKHIVFNLFSILLDVICITDLIIIKVCSNVNVVICHVFILIILFLLRN